MKIKLHDVIKQICASLGQLGKKILRYKPLTTRQIAAEAYQVISALGFDLPMTKEIDRAMSYFSNIANGKRSQIEMLPFLCDWKVDRRSDSNVSSLEYKLKTIILHSVGLQFIFDNGWQITLKSHDYMDSSDKTPYCSGWFSSIDDAASAVIKDMNVGMAKLYGKNCKLFIANK